MPRRGTRGDVHVCKRGKKLILRWTHQGHQYKLATGLIDNPLTRQAAKAKAADIAADIAREQFDPSLAKYREGQKIEKLKPNTVELFSNFTLGRQELGTSEQRIAAIYQPLISNLKRYGRAIDSEQSAREFIDLLRSRQSARTANQNLSLLQGFGGWAVREQHWEENWFLGIPKLKQGEPVQNRVPFSRREIALLLETLKTDPTHYYYYDFAYTLLSLGIRPSECIGLRWKDIDLDQGLVYVSQALGRGGGGKTGSQSRERRKTKTNAKTVIRLNPKLLALLAGRKPLEAKPGDLVFLSKQGKAIDDHSFSQRVWKPLCLKAGVEPRPPYVSRHTLLSHGIEEKGWSLPQAARIAGHRSTRMVSEVYGQALDLPEMPEF